MCMNVLSYEREKTSATCSYSQLQLTMQGLPDQTSSWVKFRKHNPTELILVVTAAVCCIQCVNWESK